MKYSYAILILIISCTDNDKPYSTDKPTRAETEVSIEPVLTTKHADLLLDTIASWPDYIESVSSFRKRGNMTPVPFLKIETQDSTNQFLYFKTLRPTGAGYAWDCRALLNIYRREDKIAVSWSHGEDCGIGINRIHEECSLDEISDHVFHYYSTNYPINNETSWGGITDMSIKIIPLDSNLLNLEPIAREIATGYMMYIYSVDRSQYRTVMDERPLSIYLMMMISTATNNT